MKAQPYRFRRSIRLRCGTILIYKFKDMNTIKRIVQRRLPLDTKYTLAGKIYSSVIESGGCSCDNCGKLIANIATVKSHSGKTYNIGFDCLDTFLLNNNLLDGRSIAEYIDYKKQLPTYIRKSKDMRETLTNDVVGIEFDVTDFANWSKYGKTSYLTFYYLYRSGKRYNSNIKLNNSIVMNDFLEVFKAVNPTITITTV